MIDNNLDKLQYILARDKNGTLTQDIAPELDCDMRTVQRYIREIIDMGMPVQKLSRGRYYLDPAYIQALARFHPREVLAIYIVLRRALQQSGHVPRFFLTAIERILPALGKDYLIDSLNGAAQNLWQLREKSTTQTQAYDEIWNTLAQAWRENLWVNLTYKKLNAEPESYDFAPQVFEPAPMSDGVYVVGYSAKYEPPRLRTLKIDRIQRIWITEETYTGPKPDINQLIQRAWGIDWGSDQPPRTIQLCFEAGVAERVMESIYHPAERKTLLDDGRLIWEAELSTNREILSWIRGWSYHVEVLAPDDLRQRIIHDLEATATVYDRHLQQKGEK